MSTKMTVADIPVQIVRKDIKNMHLAVYPPSGRVRLSVPEKVSEDAIRLFIISKLSWIKKHQKRFREQPRETPREYVSGESHYLWGRRYLLQLHEHPLKPDLSIRNDRYLDMWIRQGMEVEARQRLMQAWYRKALKERIPALIQQYEPYMKVKVRDWGVKRMRTKWGSCNPDAARIWLNLELAKKPLICLEYIVVHEMVHLLERSHNERFQSFMDQFLPSWRLHREELNSLPVRHEDWGY